MRNRNIILLGVAVVVVAAIGGLLIFNFLLTNTEPASGPITAIPIAVNTAVVETEPPAPTRESAPATAGATATPASTTQGSGPVVFQISQDQTEARFSIFEELAGKPNTVIGVTNQVAGEVAVNLNDLSQTQIGVIQVGARTFITDNDRRNGAIRRFILNSDQYEFITFTPKQITGLSGTAATGQPFTFQIAGDLMIRNITQPIVFDVIATGESATRITGTATTVVKRSDYQLTIPNVPNVANVGEEVSLEIDFVAEAAP